MADIATGQRRSGIADLPYGVNLLTCGQGLQSGFIAETELTEMSAIGRFCSLIPGLSVKLSVIVLARPSVLSAVGTCPPHDGVRRRWWINVASAVSAVGLLHDFDVRPDKGDG
jgi:hypothetical protein